MPRYTFRENNSSKGNMHPDIHCSTVYNSQDMEVTKISINRGVDKKDMVHIYNGILLNHKKDGNSAICRDIDGPRDCCTEGNKEVRKKKKNKYHIMLLIYRIQKNGRD